MIKNNFCFSYYCYLFLTSLLFIIIFPFFFIYAYLTGKYLDGLYQRLGFYPKKLFKKKNSKRLWIHAASVGEVGVAKAIIDSLNELNHDFQIILSITTDKGYNISQEKFDDNVIKIFAPIDFILCVTRSLSIIKPDAIIFLETEIWPNWITAAHKKKIKMAIANGRISKRSIKKYFKIKSLLTHLFKKIEFFSMISNNDASRIRFIGAPDEKIFINGNAKFDLYGKDISKKIQYEKLDKIKQLFNLIDNKIIVAGSTRTGEEEIILDAFIEIHKDLKNTRLIIAPRHIERIQKIKALVTKKGFSYSVFSKLKDLDQLNDQSIILNDQIILIDTIGDLMTIYGIASLVFCGGSLIPLGGQNILEPAAWGKPVMYGPYMDDFQYAKDLLEKNNASIPVKDINDFKSKTLYYLKKEEEAFVIGQRARYTILSQIGSSKKHVLCIIKLL